MAQTINTKTAFDYGTKSQPGVADGNYEIETKTDNLNILDGLFELANRLGDMFNLLDADAETWKWVEGTKEGTDDSIINSSGTYVRDIDTTVGNTLYSETEVIGGVAAISRLHNPLKRSGEFDYAIKIKIQTVISSVNQSLIGRYDTNNFVLGGRTYVSGLSNIRSRSKVGGVDNITDTPTADGDFWVRAKRDASDILTMYYDLDETHTLGTFSWTLHQTRNTGFAGDIYLNLADVAATTNGIRRMQFNSFIDLLGTGMAASHRTSGNIELPKDNSNANLDTGGGNRFEQLDITTTGCGGTKYVDKIEWKVGGVVKATYDTNITTDTTTTIQDGDLTSGTFNDVAGVYTVVVYLVGPGIGSGAVTELVCDYKAIGTDHFRFDGEVTGGDAFRFDGETF